MRRITKLTAFLLCALMLLTMVPSFAISGDVIGTNYEESAYVLGALKIMVGDAETGNFRPEDNITRAEFARVSVSLLGLDEIAEASRGVTKFNDVTPEHWANGYINVATSQGLVIGVGNGMFDPESNITYQDAITVLVRALGYEPSVASKGGYPNGYLVVAAQTGLTRNAVGAATEAVKRGIVANLAYNALEINLMEQVGFGNDASYEITDKTILADKLDVESGKGQITANGDSTLTSGSGLERDDIVINGETYKEGDSNAGAYLGYYVNYYAKEDENGINKNLILVRPEKSRNKTVSISTENIHQATATELQYWVDKEKDVNPLKIKINENANMIYNGVGISFDLSLLDSSIVGNAKFIEIDGDDRYDVVFVNEFNNLVVEDVIESSYKIIDKYGNPSITIDPDDNNYRFTMVDKDNNKVELSDLNEWDVLSYTVSRDESLIKIYVSRETVSGKITEISDDKYTINGNEYKVASNYDEMLKLEDEGIFFLDVEGKIAAVNKSASTSRNYAYLINAGLTGAIDQTAEFRIMNANGEFKTIKAEETIKFDGQTNVKSEDVLAALSENGKVVPQLININLNSSGNISEIDLATDKSQNFEINKYDFVKNFVGNDVVYKSNSGKLGRFNVSDSTIIFDIPATSDDYLDYTVRDKDMFENEGKYNISVFDVAEDLTAGLIIVTNTDGKTNLESPLSVVSRITLARDEDGNEIERLYVAHDGKIVNYDTEASGVLVKDGANGKVQLEAGDVIQFKLNASGKIEKFDLLFDISKKDTEFTKEISDKMTIIYGKVTKKFANSINVSVNGGDYENYSLNDVKVYSYNSDKTSNKVSIATAADIQRFDSTSPSRVFVRMYDDIVKEVIIVK